MRNPATWWPDFDDFTPKRCRFLRHRWSVSTTRLSQRSGVDHDLLRRWETRRADLVSETFRRAVYLGLRDLVLGHARLMTSMLEAVPGADNPPPLAGLAPMRVGGAQSVPSFLKERVG